MTIMLKNVFTAIFCALFLLARSQPAQDDRTTWLRYLDRIARPVLAPLAQGKLKEQMPVAFSPVVDNREHRRQAAYLEAFGRTLCGIAPWLEGEGGSAWEVKLRDTFRRMTLKAIANAVDPFSKDYLQWTGGQPLVDASFFAFGLVRSPWLWNHLDTPVRAKVVAALQLSRTTLPPFNNWVLFSAMVEAFFCRYGYDYDALRIEYAIRQFSAHWYAGDGTFSDGMQYHDDYYNSYVIQPYLAAIVSIANERNKRYSGFGSRLERINQRYAEIQERAINADGSFPAVGRSIAYRAGAFHHLADMALRKKLPASLPPAQVRSALTAVFKKTLAPASTFTDGGWLNIGLYGHQPALGELYINTGSLYLCTTAFLPLGLPDTDVFWTSPSLPWTAVKVWGGQQDVLADHALEIGNEK